MTQADLKFICEICGSELDGRLCKAICPNCGRMLDCSDLPGMPANLRYDAERGGWVPRPENFESRPDEKAP
ncbi:MAG: hypothetical protein WCT04_11975 [Planctomycetota bacterium]